MPRPYCATRDKGPKWGHGTIYSEAACSGKDVFYEGSDDEDYENSAARRLRYEAAGKRFLDGEEPLIFSSVLKGPFDQDGGWKNPWRSRRHTSNKPVMTTPSKVTKRRKTKPVRDDQLPEAQHNLECHLPSPESLKQASVCSHPFLEKDEVARVQSWRQSIQYPDIEQDDLSVVEVLSTNERPSVKKRRAKSSDWLKRPSSKRQKTDKADVRSVETPIRRRQRTVPVPKNQSPSKALQTSSHNTSFQSAPGRLPASVGKCSLKRQHSSSNQDDDELAGDGDALEGPSSSFASSSGILSTPSKRTSPKRAVWKKESPNAVDSEDELAQDKLAGLKAAATLSSPVSIQGETRKSVRKGATSRRKDKRSLSNTKNLPTTVEAADQHQSSPNRKPLDKHVDMENKESEDAPVEPETCVQFDNQQAETFCSSEDENEAAVMGKATYEPSRPRESSPLSSLTSLDSETWSGLSSLEEEGALLTTEGTSTESTAMTTATSDEGTEDDSSRNDSITVQPIDAPAENHDNHSHDMDEHNLPACSFEEDYASDVDGSSELSELSSSDSFLAMQPALGSNTAVDSPAKNSASNSNGFSTETPSDPTDNPSAQPNEPDTAALQDVSSTPDPTLNHNTEAGTAKDTSSVDEAFGDHAEIMTTSAPGTTIDGCSADVDEPASTFSFRELFQRLLPAWHASVSARESGWTTQPTDTEQQNAYPELTGPSEGLTDQVHVAEQSCLSAPVVDTEESGPDAHSPHDTVSTTSTWKTPDSIPVVNAVPLSPRTALANSPDSEGLAQSAAITVPGNAEVLSDGHVPKSQQSPSPKPDITTTSDVAEPSEQSNDLRAISQISTGETVPQQTPWGDAHIPNTQNYEVPCNFEALMPTSTPQFAMPPRPSTPEPMFPLQPFSAFMTPSPEHRARQKRLAQWRMSTRRSTSTQQLSSAMKSSWSTGKSDKRVSWAPLPGENESTAGVEASEDGPASETGVESRERPASPPPMTAVEDLPTSKEAEFQGHFNAVARRASEMPQRPVPTDSEQSLDSDPHDMEENLVPVNETSKDGPGAVLNPFEPGHVESGEANDLDMTDQVFQDLQDLLQPWDLDAELDQARQEPGSEGMGLATIL